jgi:hypothetical protein
MINRRGLANVVPGKAFVNKLLQQKPNTVYIFVRFAYTFTKRPSLVRQAQKSLLGKDETRKISSLYKRAMLSPSRRFGFYTSTLEPQNLRGRELKNEATIRNIHL